MRYALLSLLVAPLWAQEAGGGAGADRAIRRGDGEITVTVEFGEEEAGW